MNKFANLVLLASLTLGSASALADKPVKCKCGEKEFSGTCPDNKDGSCNCKTLKVECKDKKYGQVSDCTDKGAA
jgi:hypothetical protein